MQVRTIEHVTYTEFLSRARDPCLIVKHVGVVRNNGIARPLREEAQGEQNHQSVAVALGPEEVKIRAIRTCLHLHLNCLLNFAVFKLHRWVVDVAITVVMGQDVERFLVLVFRHEVSRGFWDPPDEDDLNNGRDALAKGRNAP